MVTSHQTPGLNHKSGAYNMLHRSTNLVSDGCAIISFEYYNLLYQQANKGVDRSGGDVVTRVAHDTECRRRPRDD
jgi:hypothetical protein